MAAQHNEHMVRTRDSQKQGDGLPSARKHAQNMHFYADSFNKAAHYRMQRTASQQNSAATCSDKATLESDSGLAVLTQLNMQRHVR